MSLKRERGLSFVREPVLFTDADHANICNRVASVGRMLVLSHRTQGEKCVSPHPGCWNTQLAERPRGTFVCETSAGQNPWDECETSLFSINTEQGVVNTSSHSSLVSDRRVRRHIKEAQKRLETSDVNCCPGIVQGASCVTCRDIDSKVLLTRPSDSPVTFVEL